MRAFSAATSGARRRGNRSAPPDPTAPRPPQPQTLSAPLRLHHLGLGRCNRHCRRSLCREHISTTHPSLPASLASTPPPQLALTTWSLVGTSPPPLRRTDADAPAALHPTRVLVRSWHSACRLQIETTNASRFLATSRSLAPSSSALWFVITFVLCV